MSASSCLIPWAKALIDLFALNTVLCLAFLIRFEGIFPPGQWENMLAALLFVGPFKLLCCRLFGVHRLTWRYVSIDEAGRILVSLTLASELLVVWRLTVGWLHTDSSYWWGQLPLGVLLIDLPLSFLALIGLRIAARKWCRPVEGSRRSTRSNRIRTLLVGAGDAGAWVAKKIVNRTDMGIQPVGFLDDDQSKWGMLTHGVPVLGPIDRLAEIAQTYQVSQVLITIAHAKGETVRRIVELCERSGLNAKVVPELEEIVEGHGNFSRIREVAIEDLLRRQPVRLDREKVRRVVHNRRVLVSGAGGSIGSELCREICQFEPCTLILVEKSENSLFLIHREIVASYPELEVVPHIADICDDVRMKSIFATHRPEVVFHAAAHKHVPMMEWNPGEAIKNNVWGTRSLADLAHAYGVVEFVMISTDKAVNPTSVMGVSKRVAELYVQALSRRSATRFVTVRFGNVLGSAGSVIPIFKEQIARGGPVTVTHPEMKRYFMTIPEACQLVLQAASMGQKGEIFILDMGEPVKIVDLANDLIHLSGVPAGSIEVHFTGMRPGEKLFEELSLEEEQAEKTAHPRIFVGRVRSLDWEEINRHLEDLRELADCPDASQIHDKFKEIVPEYACPRHVRVDQNGTLEQKVSAVG